ncbi:3-keto-5-aminohexanoate cleavage protein [Kribbella sp. NPDC050281]|uniref:3-keto-5-aminohexanoate cleavage protein n=1 Tax=Kribbella sp. NPDC050281 TaxID=3155515 RepID=UPI0033E48F8E
MCIRGEVLSACGGTTSEPDFASVNFHEDGAERAIPGVSPGADGVEATRAVLDAVPTRDVLVHGEGEWAWPVLRWASAQGYDVRVGLEDMPTGPEGQPVSSSADLLGYL